MFYKITSFSLGILIGFALSSILILGIAYLTGFLTVQTA